jgi:hypothetical protein
MNDDDTTLVGGIGADMPVMPGQLNLLPGDRIEIHDGPNRRPATVKALGDAHGPLVVVPVDQLLTGFRAWLDAEEADHAAVVRIDAVRAYFGWPRR